MNSSTSSTKSSPNTLIEKIKQIETLNETKHYGDAHNQAIETINSALEVPTDLETKAKLISASLSIVEHHKEKQDFFQAFNLFSEITKLAITTTDNSKTPITNPAEKKLKRQIIFILGTWSLFLELTFATFQYQVEKEGAENFGVPKGVISMAAGAIGSGTDFYANVMGVSPKNEGDDLVFSKPRQFAGPIKNLKRICTPFSLLTYTIGSLADLEGLGPILLFHLGSGPAFYATSSVTALAITAGGVPYYMFFNRLSEARTFTAIESYLEAPKGDHSILRYIQAGIEYFTVTSFRSMAFAYIAAELDAAFQNEQGVKFDTGAAFAGFVASCINVLSTRLIKTTDKWFQNEFAYLSSEQKAEAAKSLSMQDFMTNRVFIDLVSTIFMGVGIGLLFDCYLGSSSTLNLILTLSMPLAIMLTLYCAAIRELTINNKALEAHPDVKKEHIKTLRQNILTSETSNPLQPHGSSDEIVINVESTDSDEADSASNNTLCEALTLNKKEPKEMRAAKRLLAHEAFSLLVETMKGDYHFKATAVTVAIAQVGRMAGFLHFTDVITNLSNIGFSNRAILAIALILAPPNLINQFFMFFDNVVEVALQKYAEAYVDYCVETQAMHEAGENDYPEFKNWKTFDIGQLKDRYTKGMLDFNVEDIQYALERRESALQERTSSTPQSTHKSNVFSNCWAALTCKKEGSNPVTVNGGEVSNPLITHSSRSPSPTNQG